jgi:hypothetical protein
MVQPVRSILRNSGAEKDRYDWNALIFVLYLSVAVSVPAPECLGVDYADYETDDEYLPSVKGLLERNQDRTDMKFNF